MDDKDRPPVFERPDKKKKKGAFRSPTKLGRKEVEFSQAIHEKAVFLLRKGNCRDTVAASCGVLSDTFRNWLRWGMQGIAPYDVFEADCSRAEAEAEQDLIEGIRTSGYRQQLTTTTTLEKNGKIEKTTEVREEPGDARNLMWIAERRGARNWSLGIIERRSKEQAEARRAAKGGGDDANVQVIVNQAKPEAANAENPDHVQRAPDVGVQRPSQ